MSGGLMQLAEIIRSARVSSLHLQETQFPANASIPMHSHSSALFCISLNGSCVEVYGKWHREYPPFTLEYLPMGHDHSLRVFPRNLHAFAVEIPASWLDRVREYSLIVDQCV